MMTSLHWSFHHVPTISVTSLVLEVDDKIRCYLPAEAPQMLTLALKGGNLATVFLQHRYASVRLVVDYPDAFVCQLWRP